MQLPGQNGVLGDIALLTACAQDIKNEQDIAKIPGRHLLLVKGGRMKPSLVMLINAVSFDNIIPL